MAARAAKAGPYCSARKTEMGPEVSGRPMSSPLNTGPQRRPARVTEPMKIGVMSSLNRNTVTGGTGPGGSSA